MLIYSPIMSTRRPSTSVTGCVVQPLSPSSATSQEPVAQPRAGGRPEAASLTPSMTPRREERREMTGTRQGDMRRDHPDTILIRGQVEAGTSIPRVWIHRRTRRVEHTTMSTRVTRDVRVRS